MSVVPQISPATRFDSKFNIVAASLKRYAHHVVTDAHDRRRASNFMTSLYPSRESNIDWARRITLNTVDRNEPTHAAICAVEESQVSVPANSKHTISVDFVEGTGVDGVTGALWVCSVCDVSVVVEGRVCGAMRPHGLVAGDGGIQFCEDI